jgi:hypothetical protein
MVKKAKIITDTNHTIQERKLYILLMMMRSEKR